MKYDEELKEMYERAWSIMVHFPAQTRNSGRPGDTQNILNTKSHSQRL